MLVTKTSQITGKTNTMDINVTIAQLDRIDIRSYTKELIQDIVPDISKEEREFLMTGITPDEWKKMFGGDE